MYIFYYVTYIFSHTGMPYALRILLFQKESYVIILNGYMSCDIVN